MQVATRQPYSLVALFMPSPPNAPLVRLPPRSSSLRLISGTGQLVRTPLAGPNSVTLLKLLSDAEGGEGAGEERGEGGQEEVVNEILTKPACKPTKRASDETDLG